MQIPPTIDVSGAGRLNIVGRSNATIYFVATLINNSTGLPYDLTAYNAAELSIKKNSGSQPVVATATIVNGQILLNTSASTITASIPAIPAGSYLYDCKLKGSSVPDWIVLSGAITIEPGCSV